MANLILAFKAAQISFAKANHTAMFIFKEEESIVVCLGEERKDWGSRRETNMLNTYYELEALTYLFNSTYDYSHFTNEKTEAQLAEYQAALICAQYWLQRPHAFY